MLDHLSIQCADVAVSSESCDRVLGSRGGSRIIDDGQVIGYGFRESHIAFRAPSRAAVLAFRNAADEAVQHPWAGSPAQE